MAEREKEGQKERKNDRQKERNTDGKQKRTTERKRDIKKVSKKERRINLRNTSGYYSC